MMEEMSFAKLPVLLVDDEPGLLRSTSTALRASGIASVVTCDDSRLVLPLLEQRPIGVLMLDLSMPHMSGQRLLKEVTANFPEIPVIVVTATSDLEVAIQCMQEGAVDYLLKPADRDRMVSAVQRAFEMRALKAEVCSLRDMALSESSAAHDAFSGIATRSAQMLQIFRYLELVAGTAHPVFITGESGTGKELVARAVHRISQRAGPFVPVNVAGLDDNMFADTLFGHRKGSYTGANQEREGLVRHAAQGTLFLDEIGDLSVSSQVKLLRLLQDGTYYPLGSDDCMRSEARVVVATNCDVNRDVRSGKFRKDLYFRLSTHQVKLPALRARRADVPLLVGRFVEQAALDLAKPVPTVPREVLSLLMTYRFPGNIRELESMCQDAVAQHQGGMLSLHSFREAVTRSHYEFESESSAANTVLAEHSWPEVLPTLEEAERALINEALRRADGNQGIAASILGISRQALNRRLVLQQRETNQPGTTPSE